MEFSASATGADSSVETDRRVRGIPKGSAESLRNAEPKGVGRAQRGQALRFVVYRDVRGVFGSDRLKYGKEQSLTPLD